MPAGSVFETGELKKHKNGLTVLSDRFYVFKEEKISGPPFSRRLRYICLERQPFQDGGL